MRGITLWIFVCAYLNFAGWALSALHELNASGYGVVLAIGAGILIWRWKAGGQPFLPELRWHKLRRRFRYGFPRAFLALTILAFLGGALYLPANYDALAYRTPRVLHWLAEGQWHWIHTDFQRLNTRTAGFEWVTAPILLFSGTDRLLFLINIISFLLLPGRFFALLTQLGVRPRAAWHWMWLFPTGYGYVLQAGSVANDMFGALMALAALEFALRAARKQNLADLWTALPAAAMMTSAKAFNLMLLLPWAIAVLPALKLLVRRPVISVVVILFAASASLLPTAFLNWRACHDWTGLAAEQPSIGGGGKPYRFIANAINVPLENLVPPAFPFSSQWDKIVAHVVPQKLAAGLKANMEGELSGFKLPELQVEESAGLGMGLTLVLLILVLRKMRSGGFRVSGVLATGSLISLAAWCSVVVFMVQVGSAGPARYLLPFYPILVLPALTGDAVSKIFRSRFWQWGIWLFFAMAVVPLVLSPARPLWPAAVTVRALEEKHPRHRFLERIDDVYSAYALRADGFAPVIAVMPPDAHEIGFLAFDEPEAALWRPFGSRRVVQISFKDSGEDLRSRGLKYVFASETALRQSFQTTPERWLEQVHGQILQRFELKLLARREPHKWMLVRLE